jgi:hypothetical protein
LNATILSDLADGLLVARQRRPGSSPQKFDIIVDEFFRSDISEGIESGCRRAVNTVPSGTSGP